MSAHGSLTFSAETSADCLSIRTDIIIVVIIIVTSMVISHTELLDPQGRMPARANLAGEHAGDEGAGGAHVQVVQPQPPEQAVRPRQGRHFPHLSPPRTLILGPVSNLLSPSDSGD